MIQLNTFDCRITPARRRFDDWQWNLRRCRLYYFEARNKNESCTPLALLQIQITHLSVARNALFCAGHVDVARWSCVEELRRLNRLEENEEMIVLLAEETMHCHWLRHKAFEWTFKIWLFGTYSVDGLYYVTMSVAMATAQPTVQLGGELELLTEERSWYINQARSKQNVFISIDHWKRFFPPFSCAKSGSFWGRAWFKWRVKHAS